MKIVIVGGGFVGLTSACVLAEAGHDIIIIEDNETRLVEINQGNPPFYENGLQELLTTGLESNRIELHNWHSLLKTDAELGIVCVGTPSRHDGSLDLHYVEEAVIQLAERLGEKSLIVIKSTVLPGTTRALQEKLRLMGFTQELGMVPEFLREGSAVADASHPDRIVLGVKSEQGRALLESLFRSLGAELILTTPFNAEAVKYFSNAFLATCISFSNEMFSLFNEDSESNYESILSGWHADRRFQLTSSNQLGLLNYLKPGFGFGGSCFPKDLRALNSAMQSKGHTENLISSVIGRNELALTEIVDWIANSVNDSEEILILGVAFKESTDDIRESPAVKLISELELKGLKVSWHDSYVREREMEIAGRRVFDLIPLNFKHIVLCNHEPNYSNYLSEQNNMEFRSTISIYAVRYQQPIYGYSWRTPRQESNVNG
jgi:nucleotide sugar dehydrogenase